MRSLDVPSDDRHGWGFALLLLAVATLFLRPADLVPAFDSWPIYQFLIICCLVVAARAAVTQLTHRRLGEQYGHRMSTGTPDVGGCLPPRPWIPVGRPHVDV